MKTNIAIVATLALALTSVSCGSSKKVATESSAGAVKTETLSETESTISQVFYGEWTAFDVNGMAVTGDERPYVIFGKNADNPFLVQCYANNGCNTLNGTYAVTPGGKMKATGDFASTMRMCADAKYEMGFNLALNYVTDYKLEQVGSEYLLYLNDETGRTLMVLRKADAGFMNGAWQVTKLDGVQLPEGNELEMVIDIPDLKVHGNAGCNVFNGALFIDQAKQNSLQFRDLATTRMTCPDIAVEKQFLIALEKVESVVKGKNDTAILKDEAGKTLIVLKRLNLRK